MAFSTSAKLVINGKPIGGAIDGLEESTLKTAIIISNNAKHLAPKDTGSLTSSIMYKSKDDSGGYGQGGTEQPTSDARLKSSVSKGYAIVGTNLKYGTYQEFGTRKMRPSPWLRPAVEVAKGATMLQAVKAINLAKMGGALKKGEKIREFKI